MTKHVEEQAHGIIGLVHVTKPELGSVCVSLPPLEEQKCISTWIEEEILSLNAVINRTQRELVLIQEFRICLIADVVSGKLDVRAAALSLPDISEPELIDDLIEGDDLDEAVDDPENEEVAA